MLGSKHPSRTNSNYKANFVIVLQCSLVHNPMSFNSLSAWQLPISVKMKIPVAVALQENKNK